MKIFQQGDVILKTAPEFVDLVYEDSRDVLFKGQNNTHRVRGSFKIGTHNNQTYLKSEECELFHEEHKTINIPTGFYKMDIVNEYDHLLEESRKVID